MDVRPSGPGIALLGHAGAPVHVLARAVDEDVYRELMCGAVAAESIAVVGVGVVQEISPASWAAADATEVEKLASEVSARKPVVFSTFGAWGP